MKINEFDMLTEAVMVWGKKSNKIVRKYRCVGGRRDGRTVSNPSSCTKPFDVSQSRNMKKTLSLKGYQMHRKSRWTKTHNPVSKRLQQLNKGTS